MFNWTNKIRKKTEFYSFRTRRGAHAEEAEKMREKKNSNFIFFKYWAIAYRMKRFVLRQIEMKRWWRNRVQIESALKRASERESERVNKREKCFKLHDKLFHLQICMSELILLILHSNMIGCYRVDATQACWTILKRTYTCIHKVSGTISM